LFDWIKERIAWLLTGQSGPRGYLYSRWIFLRALALIYLSAFYSLLFQIKGLIGPQGILPAGHYLQAVEQYYPGIMRFTLVPSVLWIRSGNRALEALVYIGLLASILLLLNAWPRASLLVCFVAFVSFVSVARDFSGYQSDGMLLEAGFMAMFFAPPGLWPGLGRANPPARATLYLLRWEWFRIYFESGVVKLASGDESWRHFTAMYDYYQNGPLPTWIGWYVQQFPHWFHQSTALLTLVMELGVVWMVFLPRRVRIICFWLVTPFEISIILTANYAFLNYIVLFLGILLLDDEYIQKFIPARFRGTVSTAPLSTQAAGVAPGGFAAEWRERTAPVRRSIKGIACGWIFYATFALLLGSVFREIPLPEAPVRWVEPFRIAERYGLFAVMTHERYEIEFQGSRDGKTWIPYPFGHKPQDVYKAPGIYAPYQPRFDWNLWFASLGSWREYPWTVVVEEALLKNDQAILQLFANDPFGNQPPQMVRAVIWQYWFTDRAERRASGAWWKREMRGLYCPALIMGPDGKIGADDSPQVQPATPENSPRPGGETPEH
jgi:hypothetical protein